MDSNKEINFGTDDAHDRGIMETFSIYIDRWKWFVASVITFLIAGYLYLNLQTPVYQIETDVLIKESKTNTEGTGASQLKDLGLFSSDKVIDNEIQILKSYTLMQKVVQKLNLQVSYFTNERIRKIPVYSNLPFTVNLIQPSKNAYNRDLKIQLTSSTGVEVNEKKYPVNQPVNTDAGLIEIDTKNSAGARYNSVYLVDFQKTSEVIQHYRLLLNIVPASKDATVLAISLEDAIPERGTDILNKLVEEYNSAALADKNQETASSLAFIEDRLKHLQSDLENVEINVSNYKSANKITNISAESQIFLQSVQGNDTELGKVDNQLSILKNLENYLNNSQSDQIKVPSMLGIQDPTLVALVGQLAQAQLKKEALMETVPESNPVVSSLTTQMATLKSAIHQSVQNLKSNLLVTKRQFENKNQKYDAIFKQIPSKERGLLDVMRQQEIKNGLYTLLLQRREEAAISLASNLADSRTIDVARSSDKPVKPVAQIVMLIFFFVGLLLPAVIIYVAEMFNNKVKKRSDIEKITQTPVIAEIGYSNEPTPLITIDKPRSMVSEQIRAFRTNLQFIRPEIKKKVLLFTSGISGEGKSFVSLNLGASLALTGKKVVILEFDLRKPKLHHALDMINEKGLSNYLIGDISYNELIQQIPQQEGYYIITSGPVPPNPAELLTNGKMEILIENLQKEFDYVIIDAPPIGLVTDAQILSTFAHATFFIVRHDYTYKSQLYLIDDLYKNEKLPYINIVFNSVLYTASSSYGYGYGYGYGYKSYGYGYGNDHGKSGYYN